MKFMRRSISYLVSSGRNSYLPLGYLSKIQFLHYSLKVVETFQSSTTLIATFDLIAKGALRAGNAIRAQSLCEVHPIYRAAIGDEALR